MALTLKKNKKTKDHNSYPKMQTTKELPRVMSYRYPEYLLDPKVSPEKLKQFSDGLHKALLDFINKLEEKGDNAKD